MIRRYGDAVRPDMRYRLRPGAYALLVQGDACLLTHQAEPVPEVQLPGGGIDPGEHMIPALHREVREETGWGMALERRLGCYRRYTYMPEYDLWAEKLCHVFLGRPTMRHGPPTEPGHLALWLPLAEAAAVLGSPGDQSFVEAFIAAARRGS